jgi:hypothetical protein
VAKKKEPANFDPKRKPTNALLSDAPLFDPTSLDDECFGLDLKLGSIFDSIRHPQQRTPLSIMVSGGWGTGKTTAMAWLKHQLDESSKDVKRSGATKVYTCNFHPWKYQSKEDVWRGLIAEVILARISAEPSKALETVKRIGRFLGKSFIHAVGALIDNAKVEASVPGAKASIRGILADEFHPADPFLNIFEKQLQDVLHDWLGQDKARLCIFIDDLDRCMPDVAVQTLEALKLYLNLPNVVFVVGVDRTVLDKVIIKRHFDLVTTDDQSGEYREKARQYADKMFQVEVFIEPIESQIRDLFEKLQNDNPAFKSFWESLKGTQPLFRDFVLKEIQNNPRALVRKVNTMLLSAGRLQAGSSNQLSPDQALQLTLIHDVARQLNLSELMKQDATHKFLQDASLKVRDLGEDATSLKEGDFITDRTENRSEENNG